MNDPTRQPAPSFSLAFAQPSILAGTNILATVPGSDGTIAGATAFQTGTDKKAQNDEEQDYDE